MSSIARLRAQALLGMSVLLGGMAAVSSFAGNPAESATREEAADNLDRTVLPVPEPASPAITTLDARNAKAQPRFQVKAPSKAPNVLIVLIDDMGFGQSSAFGGPIHMPTLEKLARGGLRYSSTPRRSARRPERPC